MESSATFRLRPYQLDCVEAVERGWREHRRQLVVCPTGTGKTIQFAEIARREAERGNRTLILAHREELLQQAQDKIKQSTGLDTALEKGASSAADSLFHVTVGSVQTLHADRLKRWKPNAFDLIVVDEAHHSSADTYRAILNHFDSARVLGVTATPDRGDKRSLADVFDAIAYEYTMTQAIADGYLCGIVSQLIPVQIDMRAVRTVQGDYNINDLDSAIAPHLVKVAEEIAAHAGDRKTLIFLPLVRTSELFAALLRKHGVAAEHIDGGSPDRADILDRFARNEFQMLSNSNLLLEGYDCPDIACIVCLRPTKIRSLYAQIVGRGTRIAPGKKNLLILDFLWLTAAHKLCVPASLFAHSEDEAADMMEKVRASSGPVDLLAVQRDVKAGREAALVRKLKEQQHKSKKRVDPLQFAVSIHDDNLMEYEPIMRWEYEPPTEKQLETLERMGIDREKISCKGHASVILNRLIGRRKQNLCTAKQAQLLWKYGYDADRIGFDEASIIIDGIAANGWRNKIVNR